MKCAQNGIRAALIGLVALLALLSSHTLLAEDFATPLPRLTTTEDKIRFLFLAQEQMPRLFEEMTYHVNFNTLLEDQNKLQQLLLSKPEYVEFLKRTSYLKLEIEPKAGGMVKSYRVRPEAIEAWKASLEMKLRAIPPTSTIEGELQAALKWQNGRSSDGLLTGLIRLLPETRRGEVFKISDISKRLAVLEEELPPTLPPALAKSNGLPESTSRQAAITEVRALEANEAKLSDLVELHAVLQADDGSIPADPAEIRREIAAAGEQKLGLLADPHALRPRLTRLEERLKKNKLNTGPIQPKKIEKFILEHSVAQFSKLEEIVQKSQGAIHLVEVHPGVAIFRGCMGGDCSSRHSFPFPNDPNEKVFYVYDALNRPKGYVEGTIVEVAGVKSFYLNCINGPRISSEDVRMITDGLYRSRASLGVQQLMLLTPSKTGEMINYPSIQEALKDLAKGSNPVRIRFVNTEVRKEIEKFKSDYHGLTYDHQNSNQHAVHYNPAKNTFEGTTRVKQVNFDLNALKVAITREKAVKLLLDIPVIEAHFGPDVFTALGIDQQEYQALRTLMKNETKAPMSVWWQALVKKGMALGIDEDFLLKRPTLTLQGVLNAPDNMATVNRPRTTQTLIECSELSHTKEAVLTFLKNHQEILLEPPFINHFNARFAVNDWLLAFSILRKIEPATPPFKPLITRLYYHMLFAGALENDESNGFLFRQSYFYQASESSGWNREEAEDALAKHFYNNHGLPIKEAEAQAATFAKTYNLEYLGSEEKVKLADYRRILASDAFQGVNKAETVKALERLFQSKPSDFVLKLLQEDHHLLEVPEYQKEIQKLVESDKELKKVRSLMPPTGKMWPEPVEKSLRIVALKDTDPVRALNAMELLADRGQIDNEIALRLAELLDSPTELHSTDQMIKIIGAVKTLRPAVIWRLTEVIKQENVNASRAIEILRPLPGKLPDRTLKAIRAQVSEVKNAGWQALYFYDKHPELLKNDTEALDLIVKHASRPEGFSMSLTAPSRQLLDKLIDANFSEQALYDLTAIFESHDPRLRQKAVNILAAHAPLPERVFLRIQGYRRSYADRRFAKTDDRIKSIDELFKKLNVPSCLQGIIMKL